MIAGDGTDLGDPVNVNDVSVGNWIKEEGYVSSAINLKVTPEIIEYLIEHNGIDEDDLYYPIKLTPEILLKCGFERVQEGYWEYYSKEYTHVCVKNKFVLTGLDTNMFGYLEGNLNVHFYYLHHLQNFWRDITRTELELTL